MTGTCSECETIITLGETIEKGEIVVCSDCGINLEVIEIAQAVATLASAPQEAEDWGE